MMKTLFAISFCLVLFTTANAQQKTPDEVFYKNELGLNVSNFLTRLIDFGASNSSYSLGYPYLLQYWRRVDKKNAIRISIDGDYEERNDKGQASTGGNNPMKEGEFRMTAGYFRTLQFSRRWEVYAGTDLFHYYHYYRIKPTTNNGQDLFIEEKNFGGGAALGLTFKLFSRLTFSTEADWFLVMNRKIRIQKDADDPDFRKEETEKGANLTFFPPLDIRLSFRF